MATTGAWLHYLISSQLLPKEELLGVPRHVYMDIPNWEQTFDNSLAHKLLDFKPKLSWEEALEAILEEHKRERLTTFSKDPITSKVSNGSLFEPGQVELGLFVVDIALLFTIRGTLQTLLLMCVLSVSIVLVRLD